MRDLAIIGGGPVGLAAAAAAVLHGLDPVVLEARSDEGRPDPRVFALSYGARLILERFGVWDALDRKYPIRCVHVSQRGRFGHTVMQAEELNVEALGYVSPYEPLVQALRKRVAEAGVPIVSGARVVALESQSNQVSIHFEQQGEMRALCADWVAQADGGASLFAAARSTERDYGQCAITAEVQCERATKDCAYERFTGRGPIALLPLLERHALIWTVPRAQADALLELDTASFEQELASAYGERIGAIRLLGPRTAFHLVLRYAHRVVSERHVLIGNAAQQLHPVAGQGFNIGLRDAYELAAALGGFAPHSDERMRALRQYRAGRRLDRAGGTLFTDFIVRAFSNDDPVLGLARSVGLAVLDAAGPVKRFLMRRMIFGTPG